MEQPLVSVVVPIYNVEAYLDRCVESIVNQTYENLEIILVDDGSPDNCPQMCDAWQLRDDRIQVIHKSNAGLGMARNSGIDAATGKYIFFIDSDDYISEETVDRCVACAQASHAEVVLFGCSDAFEDGKIEKKNLRTEDRTFQGDEILDELLPGLFIYKLGYGISACMKMFDLDHIRRQNIRFKSEREVISEDAFFILEFFSCASCASVLNRNFYFYYKRSGSLTTSFKADRQEKNDKFYMACCDFVDEQCLPNHVLHYVAIRYHMYTWTAMKQLWESNISLPEKKQLLYEIFQGDLLHKTISLDVLKLHRGLLSLFFILIKIRLYFMCRLLLDMKMRKR